MAATTREKPLQGAAKVWFRYLQLAIKAKEPIAWNSYAGWGTPEELASISFNRWWKERGAALFTPKPSTVSVIGSTEDAVTVSIPHGLKREQAISQIRRILAEQSPPGSIAGSLAFAPTARVNTDALMRYQRMLEIDLDAKGRSQPFKAKLDALQKRYEKNEAKLKKQLATMRKKGSRKGLNLPKLDKLKGKEKPTGLTNVVPDVRVAHRWLAQARIVMKNVASGTFPGTGYYQRKGEASLGERLRSK